MAQPVPDSDKRSTPRRLVPLHCLALLALLLASAGTTLPARSLSDHRLPKGYHWGRCLLVVQGQTRISGRCGYTLLTGGAFTIDGPRQIYEGIDFPEGLDWVGQHSEDYWAYVFRDFDGSWTGYGNDNIRSMHGNELFYGPLRRQGSCWVSKVARICLWNK